MTSKSGVKSRVCDIPSTPLIVHTKLQLLSILIRLNATKGSTVFIVNKTKIKKLFSPTLIYVINVQDGIKRAGWKIWPNLGILKL